MFTKRVLWSAILVTGGSGLLVGLTETAVAGSNEGARTIGVVVADSERAIAAEARELERPTQLLGNGVAASRVLHDRWGAEFETRGGRLLVPPAAWLLDAPIVPESEGLRSEDAGPAGAVEGTAPAPNADEDAERDFPAEWDALEEESVDDGRSDPAERNYDFQTPTNGYGTDYGSVDTYTAYTPGSTKSYPWKAIGQLYFSYRGGSAWCTASVISPKNIIVTAAHCCYDRGARKYNTNFRFSPAENNGASPYGIFPATKTWVLDAWISGGARKDDVCVLKLGNNSMGRSVTSYTGSLGRSWNNGTVLSQHTIGYPANIGNGTKQQLCTAESYSPPSSCGGSNILNMGCNMTVGSSGSPWIWQYRSKNFVNSVVSGYDGSECTGTAGQTFNGARFTSSNIVQLCNAAGC